MNAQLYAFKDDASKQLACSPKQDVWAWAMLAYELAVGVPFFNFKIPNEEKIMRKASRMPPK